MVLYHPNMIFANFHVPDPKIRFFVRLSGFSKSAYLESTCYGEFLDTNIFPDKIGPGSGFCLIRSISVNSNNLSLTFIQSDQKLRFFMSRIFPDTYIRILGVLSGFLKSVYLDATCYGEFPEANFPGQILSRIQIFSQISSFSISFISFSGCYGVLQPVQACFNRILRKFVLILQYVK